MSVRGLFLLKLAHDCQPVAFTGYAHAWWHCFLFFLNAARHSQGDNDNSTPHNGVVEKKLFEEA